MSTSLSGAVEAAASTDVTDGSVGLKLFAAPAPQQAAQCIAVGIGDRLPPVSESVAHHGST